MLTGQHLTSPQVLAYADYTLPFILYTDASRDGLGAVLSQMQEDGQERVIAYASRGLRPSEKNYPAHKLEFLALKWSVTEKLKDYLYGNSFSVVTDNNPLTYVLTTAKLDATGHRWLAALASFDFSIRYRPGVSNANADLLSRLPRTLKEHETEGTEPQESDDVRAQPMENQNSGEMQEVTKESIAAICRSMVPTPIIEMLSCSAQTLDTDLSADEELISTNPRDMRLAQRRDPVLQKLLPLVNQRTRPTQNQLPPGRESLQFIQEFPRLTVSRGVLYRKIQIEGGEEKMQLVLPREFRSTALSGLHNDVGHLGRDKTLNLVRARFFWPGMSKDVEEWIRNCDRCIRRKTPTNQRAPLVNIKTTQPLEMVSLDFLSLETSRGGYANILVITDHFTRYAQAVPTRTQTAKATAEALVNHFILHYGLPKRLHSDKGANFMGQLISEMCKVLGIEKSNTTAYHPQGNGMTERFNRTLLGMLGTLDPEKKVDWKAHVAPLVHAYNACRHDSTGYSPFFLMYGREARLPIDLVLNHPEENTQRSHVKYVEELRKRLQDAYRIATAEADKARLSQKKNHDRHVRGATVEVGGRVLVKILAHIGKDKLADRWEQCPYLVLQQPNSDIPVFVVQREDGIGPKKTLHRNHLLPISSLPIPQQKDDAKPVKKDVPEQKRKPSITAPEKPETEIESDTTDDDEASMILVMEESEMVREPDAEEDLLLHMDETDREDTGEEEPTPGALPDSEHSVTDYESAEATSGRSTPSESASLSGPAEAAHEESTETIPEDTELAKVEQKKEPEPAHPESEEAEIAEPEKVEEPDVVEPDPPEPDPLEPANRGSEDVNDAMSHDEDSSSTESTSSEDPVSEPDEPVCRKSTRHRKPPDRFVVKQRRVVWRRRKTGEPTASETEDWQQKADYLAKLAMDDAFARIPVSFCQAILNVVTGKQT